MNYYECLAKEVLLGMYPDKYKRIDIKDKPDLHEVNEDIGIEVTQAEDKKSIEAQQLFIKVCEHPEKYYARNLERLKNLGADVNVGFMLLGGEMTDEWLYKAIDTKISKLNTRGLYDKMKLYELFVVDASFYEREPYIILEGLKTRSIELQKDKSKKYSNIYIYTHNDMYQIDLCKKTIMRSSIAQSNKLKWHEIAKKMFMRKGVSSKLV